VRNDGLTVVRGGYGRMFNTIMNGTPGARRRRCGRRASTSPTRPYPDPYQGRSPGVVCLDSAAEHQHRRRRHGQSVRGYFQSRLLAATGRRHGAQHRRRVHEDQRLQRNRQHQLTASVIAGHRGAPAVRPLPEWGRILQVQSIGEQDYRALLMRFEKRFSNRYQYTLSYTLSRVTDNSFGQTSTGTSPTRTTRSGMKGTATPIAVHAFVGSGAVSVAPRHHARYWCGRCAALPRSAPARVAI
jgi:hypothetical protein